MTTWIIVARLLELVRGRNQMDHKAFHEAVAVIAAGRYFSTKVDASTGSTEYGPAITTVSWQAYINGQSWTREYGTPEEVIAELQDVRLHQTTLDDIGEAPEGIAPEQEPAVLA
ncbi:MAG TPA: hypothetical protein VM686_00445 [Polyangiaceae bacterium]|nr:hypothetical protein [Polyangiaceae bacterium]